MSDLEGVMLSDYLLLQCISKGGVADVYRAHQSGEGNFEVAVKVYRPGYAQRESFREYFMAEAEKIGQFEHANILPFLEFGEGDDLLYAVTPFVRTGTLGDLLKKVGGKFSALQALPIIQQLCGAVQYSHAHDVIHGDIKPNNIFVAADGRMLLADFGIACGYDDSQQSLTRVGWGSAEYVAPEQSLGVLRRSSDIYALGILLFHLLTGQPPFTGQTPIEVLLKHVRQQAPSARMLVPSISDAVDGVIQIALQKRSDDRFASADELSNAYLAAVSVAPVASPVARSMTRQLPPPAVEQSSALPVGNLSNPFTPVPPAPPIRTSTLLDGYAQAPTPIYPAYRTPVAPSQPPQPSSPPYSGAFWSVDPVEWSPITSTPVNSVASTASGYLQSKLMNNGQPQGIAPTGRDNPVDAFSGHPSRQGDDEISGEEIHARGEKKFGKLLNKMLPIVVVILLLLGLGGALLSSFFFPN